MVLYRFSGFVLIMQLILEYVTCDYSCVCNYNVELTVFESASGKARTIGYLYEFDCKPHVNLEKLDDNWYAVAFEKQLGYVKKDAQIQVQTCPGSEPDEDRLTTTTTVTHTTTQKSLLTYILTTSTSSAPSTASTRHSVASTTPTPSTVSMLSTPPTMSTLPSVDTTLHRASKLESTTSLAVPTSTLSPLQWTKVSAVSTPVVSSVKGVVFESKMTKKQESFTIPHTVLSNVNKTVTISTSTDNTGFSNITSPTTPTNTYGISTTYSSKATKNDFDTATNTVFTTNNSLTTPLMTVLSSVPSRNPTKSSRTPSSHSLLTQGISSSRLISNSTRTTLTAPIISTIYAKTSLTDSLTSLSSATVAPTATSVIPSTSKSQTTTRVHFKASVLKGDFNTCRDSGLPGHVNARFGHHCYEIVTGSNRPWLLAEMYCKIHGGYLLFISNAAEEEYIYQLLTSQNVTEPVWTGLNDGNSEEIFKWSSGESLNYYNINWKMGRKGPDSANEDCVLLDPVIYPGEWDDVYCSSPHAFICKYNIWNDILSSLKAMGGNYNHTEVKYGDTFYTRHTALNTTPAVVTYNTLRYYVQTNSKSEKHGGKSHYN